MTHEEKVEAIARVAHEANRAWCLVLGELAQAPWDYAPGWQRRSAVLGVEGILSGKITSPEDSHRSWTAQKLAEGWIYGPVKDPTARTHPCLVPYAELPEPQRRKDALFYAIVTALA